MQNVGWPIGWPSLVVSTSRSNFEDSPIRPMRVRVTFRCLSQDPKSQSGTAAVACSSPSDWSTSGCWSCPAFAARSEWRANAQSRCPAPGSYPRKLSACWCRTPELSPLSSGHADLVALFFWGERKEKRDRVSLFENIRKSNISIGWLSTQLLTAEYHDDREQGILSVVHLQKPHVLTEVEYLVTVIADRGRSIVLSGCKRAGRRIRMIIIVIIRIVIDRIIMGDEIVQDQLLPGVRLVVGIDNRVGFVVVFTRAPQHHHLRGARLEQGDLVLSVESEAH